MPRTKASRRSAAAKKRLMDRNVVAKTHDGVMPFPPSRNTKMALTVTNLTSHNQQTDSAAAAVHVVAKTHDRVMPFPSSWNNKMAMTVTASTSHDQQPDQATQPRPVSVMAMTDDGVTPYPPSRNSKKLPTVTFPTSHDHRVPTLGAICTTDDELFVPSLYKDKASTDEVQPPHKRKAATMRPSKKLCKRPSNKCKRPSSTALQVPVQLPIPLSIQLSIQFSKRLSKPLSKRLSKPLSKSESKLTLDQQQHVNCITTSVSTDFPQACTVRGSFHQGHPRFGVNSNKQCVANSLIATLMCKVKNILSWSVTDIDQVLLNGDDLYSAMRDAGRIQDASGYLFVRDLPTEYTLNGHKFQINYHDDMFVGLFGVTEYGDMGDILMSVDQAVRAAFSQYDACLFSLKVNTCAIIKQGSWYVVMDSHSRQGDGASNASGRSILVYHSTIESLLDHVNTLGLSLEAIGEQFEITAVTVTSSSILQQHPDGNSSADQFPSTSETRCDVVRPNVTDDVQHEDDVHTSNEGDVVFISELCSEQFIFCPLTTRQQRSLSCKLGVVYIDHGHVNIAAEFPMGAPCRTVPITGDGNCFFRSLAFAITGSEKEHRKIRRAIVSHILRNESRYVACLRLGHSSVSEYVDTSRMKYVGTWASEVEIQAAADLLGVHIFTYSDNKWLKYSTCLGSHTDQTGIYLKHCNESHYEAVTCVTRRDAEGCATGCSQIQNTPSESASNRRKLEREKRRYEVSTAYKEEQLERSMKRYREDEVYREHVKQSSISKYATDMGHRKHVQQSSVTKYATDTEHRQRVQQSSVTKYATDTEHRQRVQQSSVTKYVTDTEHRQRVQQSSVTKYATDTEHKQRVKQSSVDRYKTNSSFAASVKRRNIETRMKKKDKRKDIEYVTEQFKEKINRGPEYICSVCHRMLFKHQVVICRKGEYLRKSQAVAVLASQCITDTYLHKCIDTCSDNCRNLIGPTGSLWICHTCHRKILDGKMPGESVINCLSVDPIPAELKCLNSLEQHLISIHIPFMRIVSLPKGGQNGVHGPVTCVPSSIPNVAQALPRVNDDDLMIRVKLKRKLTYKGHYKFEFVHPEKVKKALMYLTENNKFYTNVQFNDDWINPLQKTEDVPPDVSNIHADEEHTEHNMEDEDMDETLHDRQQHGMYMDTCLQPVDIAQEILDQHFNGIMSMAPAEGNNPVRLLTDESNEAKCFPVLFPKGTGTFHERRKEKLTLCRYLNTRILNADGRFAKNLDYIFYGQYLSELQQVVSNVSIAVRKGYDSWDKCPVTSETLTDKDSLQRMFNFDEGYKFLRPIRGTPVFWQSVQKDLFAMVRQLGIPTWFCSFSSADLRWTELMTAIFKQDGIDASSAELGWSERCALLKNNPVTAARMFDYRFHCFLKDVIMSEAQPIGRIVDYFYRVEFQQRGSPHTHCLFWVEDAPKVGKDDEDEISAFIDQYVTCEMPDDDDEMYEIVCSVQQHSKRHSKTCKKKGKTCRFNFPRPPSNKTFVSSCKLGNGETDGQPLKKEVAEAIMKTVKDAVLNPDMNFDSVDSLFGTIGINQEIFEAAYSRITKKTTIVLKRRPCDVWLNQYNRDLLRCWNANMDIQFVVDAYSCIVYIISYISKAEREMGLLLANAQKEATQQGNLDAKEALRQLGSVFLHNREVSAQESVYRLTNMRLKEGSRKVQFIPTGQHVVKMSLPLNVIRKKAECENEDDQGIWMNSITDRYKARPKTEEFTGMCLARFASEYRILSKSQSSCNGSVELDRKLGFMKKRTRSDAAVVRYVRFSPTKDPEKYYHSILQLFLPHYMDGQLKPSSFSSYQEFYETGFVRFSDDELHSVKLVVDSNMATFEKESKAIEKAEEDLQLHGAMEDAWSEICPETERERLECLASKSSATPEMREQRDEIPDLLPRPTRHMFQENPCGMSRQEALALLRSLNKKQSEIFYKIRSWCLQKTRGENAEPFHVFISGPGGVGKSVLIKAIHYEASRILSKLSDNPDERHVLLTAPTGVSAYNINAATIHTCFHIATDVKLPYEPLGDEKINSLRAELGKLQILIIDEISMVDHKLLSYIHGRLRQIKQIGDYSAFGNVSIVAVGDFYQLSPVKGKPLYTEPKGVNLWQNHFASVELTDIMRQKDMDFAQLLNRLRKRKRGDSMLEEDITMLKQCMTGQGQESTALHIYATNDQVDQHNYHMLRKICADPVIIHAQDFERVAGTSRLQRKDGHHAKVNKTCLAESLHIGVNARVMLLKNIDVSDGLVNGAFGTVSDVCFDTDEDFPSEIYVTFDNEAAGKALRGKKLCLKPGLDKATQLKPEEERVTNSGGTRRQFPLKLAWACTVHKVQGLTVDKAVVSLKKIFAAGQAYVALSRVCSLKGLIIEDFKESVIYAKQDIESAMQSMPAFIEPVMEVPSLCKILLHNVEGLSCHLDDLNQDRRYMEADIICLTETWLNSKEVTEDVQLPGFTYHGKPRHLAYDGSDALFAELKKQQHGGVGVYYKEHTNCTVTDVQCVNIECVQFSVGLLRTTVFVIYRPPSYNLAIFQKNLMQLITRLDSVEGGKIIMGDFNENLLAVSTIANFMEEHGYTQLVEEATTRKGTLIDHVYVKDIVTNSISVSVMPTYFSHHECVALHYL
ncbi:uncharacterized protein LOC125709770 [Brienomyrus brachyistius]|uniref:uncharacterized protein LOC125709770 n=1 Tax=Brienomyrus brachyistius TaxID=42636 RepID=UPI0020B325C6|nr:uncharacterized protein LOC125709770 [Brienomyrus brachyistius]